MSDMIIAQVGGNWADLVSNTTPPIRWNFLGGTDVSYNIPRCNLGRLI